MSRIRRPAVVRSLCAAVAAAVLAACGVPTDTDTRRIDPEQVPYQLTGTTTVGTTTTTTAAPEPGRAALLYWVSETGLRAVPVAVGADMTHMEVLDLLAAGPGESSTRRTVVQPGDVVSVTDDVDEEGKLIVDVDESVVQLPASEQLLAIGQIVLTLTDRSGVRSVVFTSEGQAVTVPRADGSIIDGPARRLDMIDLIG